jgi:hypothetical protein
MDNVYQMFYDIIAPVLIGAVPTAPDWFIVVVEILVGGLTVSLFLLIAWLTLFPAWIIVSSIKTIATTINGDELEKTLKRPRKWQK